MDAPAALLARDLVCEAEAARLLDRVSLRAGRGEFVGLIGPNGAGKSSLLRALAGLLRRTAGTILLDGRDLDQLGAREAARRLAIVSQLAPDTHGFTGEEVVLMGRYPHLGRFQVEGAEDRRIAAGAMRQTETEAFAGRAVTSLSGGERQRVFVARALAQQSHILLLDEPTANLDVQYQLRVLDLVRALVARGLTAIIALHDLRLAARYCGRLVLLHHGRALADGPPEAVLTPANIGDVFGVHALVYREPVSGALTVDLHAAAAPCPASGRVHVVCGGGSGAPTLYALRRAGLAVTAGPLGAGDTDRLAADALGIAYVPVPAFGPVDDDAHRRHRALVAAADCALLCDMPIGASNQRNLEALLDARRLISIERGPFGERDFTGGRARRLFAELRPAARCATPAEAVALVPDLLGRPEGPPEPASAGLGEEG